MERFLKADNWFFTGITKLVLLILVNAMFIIGCIPVVTAGASLGALYHTIHKNLMDNRGYTIPCFWEGFRSNLKQSTIAMVIFLAISAVLFADDAIIRTMAQSGKINEGFSVLFWILLGLVWLYAIWVFASIALFQNSLKNIMRNGLVLFFAELPTTVYTAVIIAFTAFTIWLIWPLIFLMPAVGIWLIGYRMQKVFRRYQPEDTEGL